MYTFLFIRIIYPISMPSVGKTDLEMCNGKFLYVLHSLPNIILVGNERRVKVMSNK